MAGVGGLRVRVHGDVVELTRRRAALRVVAVLLAGSAALFVQLAPEGAASQGSNLLVVGAVLAVACALWTCRRGLRIDPEARTIATWWAVGPFSGERPHHLDGFDEVLVRKEIVRNGNRGSTIRYPVRLEGEGGRIGVTTLREPALARRVAEVVARIAWKPLRSEVAGAPVVRQPDALDLSVAQRLREDGRVPERPVLGEGSRVVVRDRGEAVDVELPPMGAMRAGLALLAFALPAALAAPVILFGLDAKVPSLVKIAFVGSLVATMGVLAAAALARGGVRVALSVGATLRIDAHVWGVSRARELSPDAVEEIVVAEPVGGPLGGILASGGVTLVTDAQLLRVGRGLTHDELHELAAVLTWALWRATPDTGSVTRAATAMSAVVREGADRW